jgi:uncharacterized Zn finger protein (UPF0148 family)
MSINNRFDELNKLTLKGKYDMNLFDIAKNLKISPYNKRKKDLINLIIQADNKVQENKFADSFCCVCCEEFDHDFKPLEPCRHYIHETCVANSGKNDCPLCRTTVKLSPENLKLSNEKKIQYRREEAIEIHNDLLSQEQQSQEQSEFVIDLNEESINNLRSIRTYANDAINNLRIIANNDMHNELIRRYSYDLLHVIELVSVIESIGRL